MTEDEAATRLRAMLDGVDDGGALRRLGYGVAAEELFVRAAAFRMKSRPKADWNPDRIRALAVAMCRGYPRALENGTEDAFLLPGGMHLSRRSWADGTRLVLDELGFSKRVMRPSMDVEGVVRTEELDERQKDGMRATVQEVAMRVIADMRRVLGTRVPEDTVVVCTRPSDWQWRWALTLADGVVLSDVARNGEVVHDRATHVRHRMERKARTYLLCEKRMRRAQPRIARLREHCDGQLADKGLPISLRIVPSPDDAGTHMWVVADAYGPTGLAACRQVATVPFDERGYGHMPSLKHFIVEQTRLHHQYGPTPGAQSGRRWQVDAPTASRLAATGRGTRIARDAADGMPYDGGDTGVILRVVGGRMLGTFEIAPGIEWKGDRLEIASARVSQTVATALKGRSVRCVVEHPSLSDEDVVTRVATRVSKKGETLVVHVRPRMTSIERIDALAT